MFVRLIWMQNQSTQLCSYVYLKGNFAVVLTGSQNGKQYTIYKSSQAAFENLKKWFCYFNIDFKDVNIVGTYGSAALARNAENARITDVSVQESRQEMLTWRVSS